MVNPDAMQMSMLLMVLLPNSSVAFVILSLVTLSRLGTFDLHDGRQTMPVVFTYMGMYNGLYRLGSLGGMLVGGFLADRYGIGITAVFLV